MHHNGKIYIICSSGRSDHFQPVWKKQGYAGDRLAGWHYRSLESKKYSAHIYTDRNADSTLATGWNNSCNHLLYRASDKTIDIFADDISSELSDLSPDRNCSWYGSYDWCCMCNDGFCTWNSFMDDRWCNSFRGIFRRSLFSCFDKCTSGGGADGDRYLYKYKNMIKSALAPFTITCILYLTVSIQLHGKTEMPDLGHAFGSEFRLSWIALLPAAVILLLSVMQAGVKIAMIASIVTAIPVCIGLQNMAFTELPELLLNGFHSTDVTVAAMLNGGGITSMLKVGAIVCISSSYSGIFQATGILNGFQKMVCLLADRTKPYFAVLVTSILTSVMACNQTLAIMLTDQLCSRTEPDKLRFANNLEDSAVLIAPLVPWSIACAVPLTAAGAPGYSVLFAVFLYLLPLCDLVLKK